MSQTLYGATARAVVSPEGTNAHTDSINNKNLCLLSLDGGGVRGLSTLYILKQLMFRLNHERSARNLPYVKPCEVFDLIGGTSTGGLIAIMLGRLEMDVQECIEVYNSLMKSIFEKKKHWSKIDLRGKVVPQFDSRKLKEEIENVIKSRNISPEADLNDDRSRACRVFVCTIEKHSSEITCLRSYTNHKKTNIPATICEAALATSAATGYFAPVTIDGLSFADGALGANNPVGQVEDEATDIWCDSSREIKPLVECFVSIGTGDPGMKPIKEGVFELLTQTIRDIATDTKKTAEDSLRKWGDHYKAKKYFRFNVEQGLQDVDLAEYKYQSAVRTATNSYLDKQKESDNASDCIKSLMDGRCVASRDLQSLEYAAETIVERRQISQPSTTCDGPLSEKLDDKETRLWLALNNPPYDDARARRIAKPTDETLQWVVEYDSFMLYRFASESDFCSHDFLDWRDSYYSRRLLIVSAPGSGKSVLSKFIIDQVRLYRRVRAQNNTCTKVIYYFCNPSVAENNRTASSVLRALVVQLCEESPRLLQLLPRHYENDANQFFCEDVDFLWQIFVTMLRQRIYSYVFCVIDGLDVYGEEMHDLISRLDGLSNELCQRDNPPIIKLFCTSRPLASNTLWSGNQRHLRTRPEDLDKFITSSMVGFQDGVVKAVQRVCRQNHGCTFLWVGIVLREISQKSYLAVRDAEYFLQKIPMELLDLYSNLVDAAIERDPRNARILAWVIHAKRTLTFRELETATAIEPSQDHGHYGEFEDSKYLTRSDLQIHLGSLLNVDSDYIFPIHQTLCDYLLEKNVLISALSKPPRLFLADCCMRWLADLKPSADRLSPCVFVYAEFYWLEHLEHHDEILDRIDIFIKAVRSSWHSSLGRVWFQDRSWSMQILIEQSFIRNLKLPWQSIFLGAAQSSIDVFYLMICEMDKLQVQVTVEVVQAAASNKRFGKDLLKLLLDQGYGEQVTSKVLEAAAMNDSSSFAILKMLLDRGHGRLVTSEVMVAAARNPFTGFEVLALLLDQGYGKTVTSEVVATAATNCDWDLRVLKMLLDRGHGRLVTSEVMAAAARNPFTGSKVLALLLDQGYGKMVTSEVVTAAAVENVFGGGVLSLLLDRGYDELVTSEVTKLTSQAANDVIGVEPLKERLLHQKSRRGHTCVYGKFHYV